MAYSRQRFFNRFVNLKISSTCIISIFYWFVSGAVCYPLCFMLLKYNIFRNLPNNFSKKCNFISLIISKLKIIFIFKCFCINISGDFSQILGVASAKLNYYNILIYNILQQFFTSKTRAICNILARWRCCRAGVFGGWRLFRWMGASARRARGWRPPQGGGASTLTAKPSTRTTAVHSFDKRQIPLRQQ